MAGWSGGGAYTRACRWWVSPTFEYLSDIGSSTFPNAYSYATDTEGNQTIGYFQTQSGGPEQAFLLNGALGLVPISTPPNTTRSAALRISGQWFVGYYVTNGLRRPIAWQYTGMYQANYTVLQLPAGKTQGVARGINSNGQIVGSAFNTEYYLPGYSHDEVACLWTTGGSVTEMNTMFSSEQCIDCNLVRAYKVSSGDNRQAVGIGQFGTGANQLTRAFRLSNLP